MKKNRIAFILLCTLFFTNAFAQNCTLVGWASQNGGVTGGGSASPTVVSNYTDLKNAVLSASVKVIHVSGTITFPANGRLEITSQSGKTIYGMPGSRLISVDKTSGGSGILLLKNSSNIIIRNLVFEGPGAYDTDGYDNLTLTGATNVWVDHCDFQDALDGNLDINTAADYISITWCKFSYLKAPISGGPGGANDHRFSNLFGGSDDATGDRGKLRITMQYCWWAKGCKERMPRARFGKIHLVNNYFNSTGNNHCIRAGKEADLRVENNTFESVKTPIDLYQNNFTAVSSIGNAFINTSGNTSGSGTAFTPPYTLTVVSPASSKAAITSSGCGAGATMSSPSSCCGSGGTTTYTLNANSDPTAGGTISRNPSGTSYNSGAVVTLTATPATGYTFIGWTGAITSGANPITVTMDTNKTVTANFRQAEAATYTLTTNSLPVAGGTVARSSDSAAYSSGTVIMLTATASSGYMFTGWSGDASGSANPLSVTMNANKTITANFQLVQATTYTLNTNASPAAGGSISRSPDSATYSTGVVITLTATATSGYTFSSWSGAVTSTANPITVTMDANKTVTANFTITGGGGNTRIRIEDSATPATGLCSYDGSVGNNSGASNGKIINLTNSAGKAINWSISVPAAGSYSLNWRYTNGSSSNAYSMKLIVNGVTINSALPFPKTGSSSAFLNTTASVNLTGGNNTIRLETTTSSATADVDWLEITGVSPATGNCVAASTSAEMVTSGKEAMQSLEATEIMGEKKTGVYPNPAKGSLNVSTYAVASERLVIQLNAVDGKIARQPLEVSAVRGFNKYVVNVLSTKPGNYYLVILHENGMKEVRKVKIL